MHTNSNYPPGVTGNEPQITGETAWEDLMESIQRDCDKERWTDMDCYVAWQIGRDAMIRAKKLGGKFPHDM